MEDKEYVNIVEVIPETDQDSQSGNSESTLSTPSGSEDSGDSVSSDSPRDCEENNGGVTNLAFEGSFEKGEESQTDTLSKKEVALSMPDGNHSNIELKAIKGLPICDVEGGEKRKQEYGEYFIPVNEKKKSFRGEKLYVTKTRGSKGGCRQLCCWLFALTILAGAIAVAVMIGTGIIDISSPQRIKEGRKINTQDQSNVLRLSEVKHPDAPNILTNDPDFFKKTETDIPPPDSVPNAFTGEFKITNMKWNEALHDKSSPEFQKLSVQLKDDIHSLFADIFSEEAANLFVKITKFNPGSIVVSYTVGLVMNNKTILTATNIREKILSKVIGGEEEMFVRYSIASDSVAVGYLKDNCNLLRCTHKCEYSYQTHTSVCQCPDLMELNSEGICVNVHGIVLETTPDKIQISKPTKEIEQHWEEQQHNSDLIELTDFIPIPPADYKVNVTQENETILFGDMTVSSDEKKNLAIVSDSYEENLDTPKISETVSMENITPKSAVILFNQITITNSPEANHNETKHERNLFNKTLESPDSLNSTIGIIQSTSTTEIVEPNTSQPAETEPESKYNETKPESNSFNKTLDSKDSFYSTIGITELTSTTEKVTPNTSQPAETELEAKSNETKPESNLFNKWTTNEQLDSTDPFSSTMEISQLTSTTEKGIPMTSEPAETVLDSNTITSTNHTQEWVEQTVEALIGASDEPTIESIDMVLGLSADDFTDGKINLIFTELEGTTYSTELSTTQDATNISNNSTVKTISSTEESSTQHTTNILNNSTTSTISSTKESSTQIPSSESTGHDDKVMELNKTLTFQVGGLVTPPNLKSEPTTATEKEQLEQLFEGTGVSENIEGSTGDEENLSYQLQYTSTDTPKITNDFEEEQLFIDNSVEIREDEKEGSSETFESVLEINTNMTEASHNLTEKEDTNQFTIPATNAYIQATKIPLTFSSENDRGEISTENINENQSTLRESVTTVVDSDIFHLFSLDIESNTSEEDSKLGQSEESIPLLEEAGIKKENKYNSTILRSSGERAVSNTITLNSINLPKKSFNDNEGCGRWENEENEGNQNIETGSKWPSLALIYNVKKEQSCTVSIISSTILTTSYSCLSAASLDPLEWVVFGGNTTSDKTTQIKMVKNIISHPAAKPAQNLTTYDVSLVQLLEPLEFNNIVNPICISKDEIKEGQLCVTAGWAPSSTGISFNQYLTYLPQPIVAEEKCNSSSLYNGHLTESMICSKSNGDSTVCHDDMGSPLMCLTDRGAWQLMAVKSKSLSCKDINSRPAVFTSIPSVEEWIQATIGSI